MNQPPASCIGRSPAPRLPPVWRRSIRAVSLCLAIGALAPVEAIAQRALHWDNLEVVAHLNADGSLAVVETQTMVFTGEWTGGERTFDLRPHQQYSFSGMSRAVPDGWRALTEDAALDDVDDYAWTDGRTLRWRSRRASDPPFAGTTLRYQLRYILSGILVVHDGRYRLDHDFTPPDRQGVIQHFVLHLTLDPIWQPSAPLPPVYTAGPIAAGKSFVLDLPLRYTGTQVPIAVDQTWPRGIVVALEAVLGLTLLAMGWFFARR